MEIKWDFGIQYLLKYSTNLLNLVLNSGKVMSSNNSAILGIIGGGRCSMVSRKSIKALNPLFRVVYCDLISIFESFRILACLNLNKQPVHWIPGNNSSKAPIELIRN